MVWRLGGARQLTSTLENKDPAFPPGPVLAETAIS